MNYENIVYAVLNKSAKKMDETVILEAILYRRQFKYSGAFITKWVPKFGTNSQLRQE